MDVREALDQVAEIRQQLTRGEVFRGYRAASSAAAGMAAFAAAAWQARYLPNPTQQLADYLRLWVGVAVGCLLAAVLEMVYRAPWWRSTWSRTLTSEALLQLLPSLLAGGLVTLVIARSAPEAAWMLPGLWQILLSLGVFASCRLVPRPAALVAVFYLASGLLCLLYARDAYALSPLAMGLPFGFGQLLAAAVLYWTLERTEDRREDRASIAGEDQLV